ncbi:MAG: hypothetical protein V2B20_23370 [Pseudomonadota bacterium]
MTTSIQHLKKVKLAILAGNEAENYSLTPSPMFFEFLYGIGTEGLEPFEIAFSEKCSGESLALVLKAAEAPAFFGRFLGPVRHLLGLHSMPPTLYLHMTVMAVNDAENREVVQALATSAGHGGCGGSCDCGCS